MSAEGAKIAKGFMVTCETKLSTIAAYFGGIIPQGLTFNIVFAKLPQRGEGTMGAYHYGCGGTDIYVDIIDEADSNLIVAQFLVISQIVEVFSDALDIGWDCETTSGEALSRVIAADMTGHEINRYTTASYWLNSTDRQNFVKVNKPAYEDLAALGCSVLFLNYLHYQLKISWNDIIANGASTLAETFTKLVKSGNGFKEFKDLIENRFPSDKQAEIYTDNPFAS